MLLENESLHPYLERAGTLGIDLCCYTELPNGHLTIDEREIRTIGANFINFEGGLLAYLSLPLVATNGQHLVTNQEHAEVIKLILDASAINKSNHKTKSPASGI